MPGIRITSTAVASVLLAAVVGLASGCGGSEAKHTSTASASTGASAPGVEAPSAAKQSTSATTTAQTRTGASGTTQTTRHAATPATPTAPSAVVPPAKITPRAKALPLKAPESPHTSSGYKFPYMFSRTFTTDCTGAGGSVAACECMITKYEAQHVEESHAIAEMVVTGLVLMHHAGLNYVATHYARECHASFS